MIEVRAAGVNKGSAALDWLQQVRADFLLGIGDDWTDEDLFKALPPSAFTVRVGLAETAARFHLSGPPAVRRLLQQLDRADRVSAASAAPDDWFAGAPARYAPARPGAFSPPVPVSLASAARRGPGRDY